jgi:hypothetical protein
MTKLQHIITPWRQNFKPELLRKIQNFQPNPSVKYQSIDINPLKAHWLSYVPQSLTLKNSTFCQHSVLMWNLWYSGLLHGKESRYYSESWLVRMEPIRCPETSVNNYHKTSCNNPKDRRFQQHRGGSLKSSVFMCFLWISEQTAIISLYNINWLVCWTETECVYCAVRTGSLNKRD